MSNPKIAPKRKPITKKTRFEVFKRDNFTCQYCGKMAPDVILEIDHIIPVSEGGDNELPNLVTSCRDCNRGKGKRKLSDRSELKIQQQQLKELAKKREQLQMMMEWRKELLNFDNEQINAVESIFNQKLGRHFTEQGREIISKLIKRCGVALVCESVDVYISKCYQPSIQEFSKGFSYIGSVCYNKEKQKTDPNVYWVNKAVYYCNRKFFRIPKWKIKNLVSVLINGEDDCNNILSLLENCNSWDEFVSALTEDKDV